ncbi:uncharacterized protein LOC100575423 [Acyrthosiphon pisum]|uniref:ACYPI001297 protein n=1 Tax=Acyrthosiphon pisum TaxID=7029 RepID=C4WUT4_ACYPI|nr:uncharacterized protein LOC100575423 [Acyrthosiphon pisum]BAH71654.1 ACYPI001297 [Acyrthosiphon pisum]|eukprot:NP_001233066.1 uncharacterized protein LOC100575423 [Acyrthosiphon pisum]
MVDERHNVIKFWTIVPMKRSAVHRYDLSRTAERAHWSALDALDLAVSSGTVVGTFAEANVFFTWTPRPTDGGESLLPVRTRSDDNERGTVRQLHEDINLQACITAGRYDFQRLSAPRCHCDYPQPPDADLITVDIDHAGADGVKRNTTKDGSSQPHSKISASSSSCWRRSKKFVTDLVVYVACAVCLCC